MPADSYDYKPHPDMREFGQLMQHIAANNAFYLSRLKAGEIPPALQPPEKSDKTTSTKYLTDSFEFCAEVIVTAGEGSFDKDLSGQAECSDANRLGLVVECVYPHGASSWLRRSVPP